MMEPNTCPVCGGPAARGRVNERDIVMIDCNTCGSFKVTGPTLTAMNRTVDQVGDAERRADLAYFLSHRSEGDDDTVSTDSAQWMVDEGKRRRKKAGE